MVLLFYRGFWWPPCRAELRSYVEEGVVDKFRAAGGEVYAITSEPQRLADHAHDDWELSFESIGDPHQEISRTCSEKGLLTLYANAGSLSFLQSGVNWKIDHLKGSFQPGVLVLTKQYRVLYRWRSVPSDENLNGTTMRPTAAHVWEKTRGSLETGDSAVDASFDDNPVVDQNLPSLILFLLLLSPTGGLLSSNHSCTNREWNLSPRGFKRLSRDGFCSFLSGSSHCQYCQRHGLEGRLALGWYGQSSTLDRP